MLCTIEQVQRMPGFNNTARFPVPWMNNLIGQCDKAIKKYCKQNIELQSYVDYYSGNDQRDIIVRELPLQCAQTTLVGGGTLPTATLSVSSTKGFNPGVTQGGVNTDATPAALTVQLTGANTYTTVTYTGVSGNTFTGCSGGTGSFSNGNRVWSPSVWVDANGYAGQSPTGFADGTLLVMGAHWFVDLDRGGKRSNRGLIRRIAGGGSLAGFYPEVMYSGKLGAYRLPTWFRGSGNIKVSYSAGYALTEIDDVSQACAQLVAQVARTMPTGANLSSESLGAYSYNVLMTTDDPEMGDLRRTLAPYRESSF